VGTFLLFLPALNCGFVNVDDPDYVTLNPRVRAGLSAEDVRWAFTAFHTYNWHPLTWLSLQLDATLWKTPDGGPDPRGFHLTNLLLHAANAGLLFLALRSLTGAFWRSLAVAALFAVHPLRAESVVWVAERKDVLSTFFGLLALWAYAVYARQPSLVRYLLVAVPFALSLLCKPMLVTLPFLLLVLDWWPLGRWPGRGAWQLVREKLPLFALVFASSVVTFQAQAGQGAVGNLTMFPPSARLTNAAVSYVVYLSKTFWPARLAVYYPHPVFAYTRDGGLSLADGTAAAVVLAVLTGIAAALHRRSPYLLAGWLWYLGTLVPTIGIVQVGAQAYADRYTYLPQVGILIALCWAAGDLAGRLSFPGRAAVFAGAAAAAVALAVLTRVQISYWHDSLALWKHNRDTTGPSPLALSSYASALIEHKRVDEAVEALREALRLDPGSARFSIELGNLLLRQEKADEAARYYDQASQLARTPAIRAEAHLKLGSVLAEKGDLKGAARHDEEAIKLAPERYEGYFQLGQVQSRANDLPGAAENLRRAVRLKPDLVNGHAGLGETLIRLGKVDDGIAQLREAVQCDASFGPGHLSLGMALEGLGKLDEASRQFEEAVQYSPEFAPAWYELGGFRIRHGRLDAAVDSLSRAVERDPKSVRFRTGLAAGLDLLAKEQARSGNFQLAVETARRARDEAGRAGRADMAQQIENRRALYEKGDAGPPDPPAGKP
jgi:tetratricopeptide (TPR) repeat protein